MKNITAFVLSVLGGSALYAQTEMHPITTGVPFLTITADARAAGMADMGVATSSDVFSQQHNASKYAFAKKDQGIALSYTPYMAKLASDMSLGQLNYYNKYNDRSAFAVGFRYFGMGEVTIRQDYNSIGEIRKPNEFAIDASYALKLSENFSGAVTGRFINSSLKYPETGDGDASSASTFAVDISGFYQSDRMSFADFDGRWRFGFNFQNLGPKISYSDQPVGDFLPANLKLGAGFDFILDDYNTLTLTTEFNKLLVPTPPTNITDPEEMRKYNDIGWFKGVFKSFGDAPGGFSEEMKEIAWSFGAEYWYDNVFAFRAGYFNENKNKGARQYATLGAGFKYSAITVDLSYLFSTSKVTNPLENTLRFSLSIDLGRKTYHKG